MTLVQLRHLLALARTGSFSQAAQSQHLTQPAMSRSIRALEDEFGQPLFDRVGRRVEPTPFGREMLQRAELLLADAESLRDSGRALVRGEAGSLRLGMGSGPGALLMTPLLMHVARERPRLRLEVARGHTTLLVQALRERRLDALVVDARSLVPAPDLRAEGLQEMRGAFMVRRGHALTRRRGPVRFADLQRYPIASTPLSDEVARLLMTRYGPAAHPDACVTLRCEEITSLVAVARQTDAVLLAVRASAPELVELTLTPALDATARFALVTLARRTEPPSLALVRELMTQRLHDPV